MALALVAPVAVATAAGATTTTAVAVQRPVPLSVHANPKVRTIRVGHTAKYRVTVKFTGAPDVGLSLGTDGRPNHINFFFTPNPTTHTAVLTVETAADTKPGRYTLRIFADTQVAHVTTKVCLVIVR